MKKLLSLFISTFFILSLLPSCEEKQSDKLQVFTSFYVLEDFVKELAEDYVEVTNLSGSGDPHSFEISAAQMARLANSDLFIYIGGIDGWANDISDTAKAEGCYVLKADGNVDTNNEHDPHIWLNPDIAIAQMEQICNALCEIDNKNSEIYKQNYNLAKEKYISLNKTIENAKQKTNSHTIITSHGAYGHLCSVLGMEQLSIEGIHSEGDPTAAQIAKIIDFAQANNIKYIFTSPNETSRATENVAAEIGADILYLDSMEVDNQNGGYFAAMEKNINKILKSIEDK